ncbi:hypothetical protein [Actinoplanes derwentensis]|uniref:Uncharacterized protein n=1 Tax=Actinoplanes derwentensis TaxID=113562 RepID=A0A1H2AXX6_9ACTN|nr:hypothetical protein [Actinoplanes derwentensis]SDT50702.1 hypothetical protein SAMN04489716_4173 [Actinoplanes derwentensis]
MRSPDVDGPARLHSWRHVREFAVPASMIITATARRLAGDWAGACAAAHVDVDLDLRAVTAIRGRAFAAQLRTDLRRLAPDLLRWHLPRTIADGLLRPGLTMSLTRYPGPDGDVHLVARTAPSWADFGQRISLALWDPGTGDTGPHPRPRPDRRFRLDLHPHLWAADHLRERSGLPPGSSPGHGPHPHLRGEFGFDSHPNSPHDAGRAPSVTGADRDPAWMAEIPADCGYAAHRWVAEAAILRAADGHDGPVAVRLKNGRRLLIGDDGPGPRFVSTRGGTKEPVLPYAATWLPPDLELLHAGLIHPDRLHPLVARALAPDSTGGRPSGRSTVGQPSGHSTGGPARAIDIGTGTAAGDGGGIRLVECRGETHRLGIVDGKLVPLDHQPDQLRREELLVIFGGTPLPCLQVISADARNPYWLDDVRSRLDHGDRDGATALVTELLGPDAEIEGALREAFDDAADGVVEHGLYRAGLTARILPRLAGPFVAHERQRGRPSKRGSVRR